jgi:hypothetical protein
MNELRRRARSRQPRRKAGSGTLRPGEDHRSLAGDRPMSFRRKARSRAPPPARHRSLTELRRGSGLCWVAVRLCMRRRSPAKTTEVPPGTRPALHRRRVERMTPLPARHRSLNELHRGCGLHCSAARPRYRRRSPAKTTEVPPGMRSLCPRRKANQSAPLPAGQRASSGARPVSARRKADSSEPRPRRSMAIVSRVPRARSAPR